MKKLTVVALLLVCSQALFGQSFYAIRHERSLILTGGLGSASYFGELKERGRTIGPDFRQNINVGLEHFFTNRIAARTEFNWVRLYGDDAKGPNPTRNLSFKSNIWELNAVGIVNALPNGVRFYQRAVFNVYGFVGIGIMHMNPKTELNGKTYALHKYRTENKNYSLWQPVIPYGIGLKYMVGPFLNVCVEGGWRLTFTDYIDDVSTKYPSDIDTWDPSSIRHQLTDRGIEGFVGNPGNKRGNPGKKDSYYLLNVKVEYYLPHNFLWGNNSRKLYNQKRKAIYRRYRRR